MRVGMFIKKTAAVACVFAVFPCILTGIKYLPAISGSAGRFGEQYVGTVSETDTILENTEENILTLITCVENEPNYRRCVQAEEKNLNYNY